MSPVYNNSNDTRDRGCQGFIRDFCEHCPITYSCTLKGEFGASDDAEVVLDVEAHGVLIDAPIDPPENAPDVQHCHTDMGLDRLNDGLPRHIAR